MVKCEKERSKLKHSLYCLSSFCALMLAAFGAAVAEPAPNPRSATMAAMGARADGKSINRSDSDTSRNTARRASRSATVSAKPVTERTHVRSAAPMVDRRESTVVRAASTGVARSATVARGGNTARSAAPVASGVARAASTARATAVFNDISKIGGGYGACRDSYATCMDQFCANANDTYRRCFCSARFTEFRDTEYALDEARQLLQQFEDNSLNAVDKTAAEVNAMYSATVGEAAIKKDTSLAQKTLNEIGDLLSGKKKASTIQAPTTSLGTLSLDFSTSMDDIWGGGSAFDSVFERSSSVDMSALEGANLYNAANKQCMQVIKGSCENDAVLNMASSAYGIMVSQDCNAYERALDRKREEVLAVVRTAEKTLRQARLEEYRAHNSADVNECLSRVREAMLTDTACGDNYYRCLDYTGKYINLSTGEPIYTPELFQLTNLVKLVEDDSYASRDNATAPTEAFDKFLDERRIYAESALDSCRDIADTVWFEFKRAAKIEIEQAQNEKIEEIKASCMETVRECYDTQSNHLKSFDDTTAQMSGGLAAYAAQQMCVDKLMSCASLYGNGKCNAEVKNGRVTFDTTSKDCGMTALLEYANTVDSVRIAEGCVEAISKYITDTCTPTGDGDYPMNCRTLSKSAFEQSIMTRVSLYCREPDGNQITGEKTSISQISDVVMRDNIQKMFDNVVDEINAALMEKCTENNGLWYEVDDNGLLAAGVEEMNKESVYYSTVFGRSDDTTEHYGRCAANDERNVCLAMNDMGDGIEYTSFDASRNVCVFQDSWYEYTCTNVLNGEWSDNTCYWDSRNKLENE